MRATRVVRRLTAAGTPDGRGARRGETRSAIFAAALSLFAAQGVTATSVDDIAERAGTAKGSIFYNFGSKSGLVHELMLYHATRIGEVLAAAGDMPGVAGRRKILDALLTDIVQHPDVARLMLSELFHVEESWLEVVASWRAMMTHELEENLVAERGEDRRSSCSIQASAWVGATLATGLTWLLVNPELSHDEVLDTLVGMSLT